MPRSLQEARERLMFWTGRRQVQQMFMPRSISLRLASDRDGKNPVTVLAHISPGV